MKLVVKQLQSQLLFEKDFLQVLSHHPLSASDWTLLPVLMLGLGSMWASGRHDSADADI